MTLPFLADLDRELGASLTKDASNGLNRQRRLVESPCGTQLQVDGRKLLSFASNDYLGLAKHPSLKGALIDAVDQWGVGSAASPLVSGHLAPHAALEQKLAEFTGFPSALSFSTGYMANLAVLPTLAGRGSAIFADKLNHASLIDAVQLCKANGAQVQRYPHNDPNALQGLLKACPTVRKFIVTDAVFSMDGDLAPLPELLELAEQFNARLIVDDAHGFGVLGPQGAGSLAEFGIAPQPRIILMGTLGKAAGGAGAFVAGSETLIEYLLQTARTYIFSTAAPPALAAALCTSLEIIATADDRRATLRSHTQRLQTELVNLPWQLSPSSTAIQPIIVGANQTAIDLSALLWERGFWVPAIRPPTVPKGTARLRLSLSAAHRPEDIDALIAALKEIAASWPGR